MSLSIAGYLQREEIRAFHERIEQSLGHRVDFNRVARQWINRYSKAWRECFEENNHTPPSFEEYSQRRRQGLH